MVVSLLLVLLSVGFIQYTEGLVECMNCKGVPEPHDCKETTICAEHEQCGTEFYITPQGHVFYDLGCKANRVCDALNKYGNGKKRDEKSKESGLQKRQDENLYICQECCNTEHCNQFGCNDPDKIKLNRTFCYSCIDVAKPGDCDMVDVCDQDKICYARHFINDMFEERYKMGCEEKKICEMMLKSGNLAGHPKRHIGGFDSIDLCYYCCNNNFCNRKECEKGLLAVTTSKAPTTSTAVPTTKAHLTTHAPTQKPTTQSTHKPHHHQHTTHSTHKPHQHTTHTPIPHHHTTHATQKPHYVHTTHAHTHRPTTTAPTHPPKTPAPTHRPTTAKHTHQPTTPPPTHRPTTAKHTHRPTTPAPTHRPTTVRHTHRPTTPAPTHRPTTPKPTTPAPTTTECYIQTSPGSQSQLYNCSGSAHYCITHLTNYNNGYRETIKGCATQFECQASLIDKSSGICSVFHEDQLFTSDFKCSYCCTKNKCNGRIVPPHETVYVGHVSNTQVPPANNSVKCYTSTSTSSTAQLQTCPASAPYCVSHLTNYNNGYREIDKGCATESECKASLTDKSNGLCEVFNEDQLYTEDFKCSYCCTKDKCNGRIVPPHETLYTGHIANTDTQAPPSNNTTECIVKSPNSSQESKQLCLDPASFCITHLKNYNNGYREIKRGCASKSDCDVAYAANKKSDNRCFSVDENFLDMADFECSYCCDKDICNSGIIPPHETLYQP